MSQFKSRYAEGLLKAHQPTEYTYLLVEIGLEPNAANAALVDEAYAELQQRGYVEQSPLRVVMPYNGAVARKPFKVTEAGIKAKKLAER